jgi:hypothetical protein
MIMLGEATSVDQWSAGVSAACAVASLLFGIWSAIEASRSARERKAIDLLVSEYHAKSIDKMDREREEEEKASEPELWMFYSPITNARMTLQLQNRGRKEATDLTFSLKSGNEYRQLKVDPEGPVSLPGGRAIELEVSTVAGSLGSRMVLEFSWRENGKTRTGRIDSPKPSSGYCFSDS